MTSIDFENLLNKNIPKPDDKIKNPVKIAFRNVAQKYANFPDCISYEGSKINKGRYNLVIGLLILI